LPAFLEFFFEKHHMVACPLHILIVEHHPDGRETLRNFLELLGYGVDTAADGLQGVQKALAGQPEVALVDIGLPHLDGYQVAEQLRSRLGRKILLIACTAYGQPEDRRRALEAGFDAHLVKPLDLMELLEHLGKGRETPQSL
jgi:CheY-like chemotaxis protein